MTPSTDGDNDMAELKLYTATEVCEILKVSKRTLYNYLRAGQIHGVKIGREWRFTEESVQEFTLRGTTPDYYEKLASMSGRK